MALRKKSGVWYGDGPADIQPELLRYSKDNGYPTQHYATAACAQCGHAVFKVLLDDEAGCAKRICASCSAEHFVGDSAEFSEEAELEECECPCGKGLFEVVVGIHLYQDSEDVKWLYMGFRCTSCGMTAVYGDWKNEYQGYRKLLALV